MWSFKQHYLMVQLIPSLITAFFLEISHYFSKNVNLMSKTLYIFYNNEKYELTEMNCLRGFTFLMFLVIVHVLPNYVKKSDHYLNNAKLSYC